MSETNLTAAQAPVVASGRSEPTIGLWGWVILAVAFAYAGYAMRWDWLLDWYPQLIRGLGTTMLLLATTVFLGMLLAIPIGLVQVFGPRWLSIPARAFCTVIRG